MTRKNLIALSVILALGITSPVYAQGASGREIVGQPLQVTTRGITNTVFLAADGSAKIITPSGKTVEGGWSASNGNLCLKVGSSSECWPYAAPFQTGKEVSLTSSCGSISTWVASATNE